LDYLELKENLIDVIKECHTKIGYSENAMSFYYPVKALNRFLDSNLSLNEMGNALEGFAEDVKEDLGQLKFKLEGDRYRITVPKKGSVYVNEHIPDSPFLKEFVAETIRPGCDIESILVIFNKYSEKVICKNLCNEEFEYLIYFEDGQPDHYRYCLEFEFGRAIYHRFTPKEYEALGLEG